MASFTDLQVEQLEPGIWCCTIDRPKALNALNQTVLASLLEAFAWLQQQHDVRAVLLTGAGEKAFVAGADIAAMQAMTPMQARQFSQLGMQVMATIEQFPAPVIALVNGYCLGGGCELALSCDFILASDTASFGQPEVALGIPPGFGGTQRLARVVGKNHAMGMILTGERIDASEALRIQLCNQVTEPSQLLELGLSYGRKIAANSPTAVALAKELINKGQNLDLQYGCQMETELFALSFSGADQTEGMTAFLERRTATFSLSQTEQ